ncbi:MAG: hypothetical protein ACLP4V_15535 [Methylocella sp.]
MAKINWNGGQLITLNPGDTATCAGGLNPGQIYGIFLYNSTGNDANAPVNVVWSNSQPPVLVTVPGTTAQQGLAALCFVSGDDTNTLSISLGQTSPGAKVQAFLGSVKMPVNTSGIGNFALQLDGQNHPFQAFTRFYAVPESHWYSGQIQSDINQFISVQFKEASAIVNIVNQLVNPDNVVKYAGPSSKTAVTINSISSQTLAWNFQGNGTQFVWINADSVQNTQTATISVQSLAAIYDAYNRGVLADLEMTTSG